MDIAQLKGSTQSLDRNQLVKAISYALNIQIKNSKKPSFVIRKKEMPETITAFDSVAIPSISIEEYLQQLVDYLVDINPAVLLLMYTNMDTYFRANPNDSLDGYNVHRLILTSLAVSQRSIQRIPISDQLFAKKGRVPISEMNVLVKEFLTIVDNQFCCDDEAAIQKCKESLIIQYNLYLSETRLLVESKEMKSVPVIPVPSNISSTPLPSISESTVYSKTKIETTKKIHNFFDAPQRPTNAPSKVKVKSNCLIM